MLLTCSHISHTLALLQSIKDYRQIKQAQDREMLRDLPQKDAASGGVGGRGRGGAGGLGPAPGYFTSLPESVQALFFLEFFPQGQALLESVMSVFLDQNCVGAQV